MAYVHPAWEEYQRQRFTRPDGDRYLKPPPFDHKAFIAEYRARDSLDHAESTLLLRAFRARGTLSGRAIEIHTDRDMCYTSCPFVLPKLGLELGNPVVTFVGPNGARRTMRDGGWD